MYNKLAIAITNKLVKNENINQSDFDIYAYGFELLIAYVVYFICLLFVAVFTKTVLESTMFCLGFMFVRKYAGGYHAATYLRCQALFIITQLLFVGIIKRIPSNLYMVVFTYILVSMFVSIWIYAPIDNENKEFNETEFKYFKKMSRFISITIVSLSVSLVWVYKIRVILLSFLIGVYFAASSIVVGYFAKNKRSHNKEVRL